METLTSSRTVPEVDLEPTPPTPRILVVDDDQSVLSVVGKLLEAHQLRPEVFSSAEKLLLTVRKGDIGCVVTDLKMPGMDGLELLRKLKQMKSSLGIIVITGHADVPKAIEIMGSGAITLIEKPFKAANLIAEVRRAIEISQQICARRTKVDEAVSKIERLSEDELAIMLCAARGMPNKAIAAELTLSPRTVDRRRQSALTKLEASSVAEFAVLYATAQDQL